ncbi:ketopantoate reductase PanE/ApbA C terminal-domain-containing protein [Lipomyces japonicus]|uniref:ketopantoate reductase PanE/ApbA C terminal-domain-containing protein n=1 Tax=Lipomyces japonicus TaxID=56871 RepID=UPI0034CF6425
MSSLFPTISKFSIIGVGSIGKFIAHSVRKSYPDVEIDLFMSNQDAVKEFKSNGNQITAFSTTHGTTSKSENYNCLSIQDNVEPGSFIIVATKAGQVIQVLEKIKSLVVASPSRILLLQNGLGIINQINSNIWPEESTRPHILYGINTHGITSTTRNSIEIRGQGSIRYANIPNPKRQDSQAHKISQVLSNMTQLAIANVSYETFVEEQFCKFVVNCCINPLTALYDCDNGQIVAVDLLRQICQSIISEIVAVSDGLPELQVLQPEQQKLLVRDENLMKSVINVAKLTSRNMSSMRADVIQGRQTEIDHLNGFVASLAKNIGRQAPVCELLTLMIKTAVLRQKGWESKVA